MKNLRAYIDKWMNGEKVNGVDVSLYDIHCCIHVYNGIARNEKPEFVNEKVKKILDKCNIKTIKHGIGWKIA